MLRTFLFVLIVGSIACNSSSNNTDTSKEDSAIKAKAHTWTQEDQRIFLSDCVDKAKGSLGDTIAYAQCNCVLGKLKEVFPNLDSAGSTLNDSTKAAAFASKCK